MNLKDFVKITASNKFVFRPRIICKDGFTMSVQGSEGHYCSPRKTQDWYNEMEIGFPTQKEEDIMSYMDGYEDPTESVYGYVPCEIIEKVIDKHGGIDELQTFNPDKLK